jgi:hypothetical protein
MPENKTDDTPRFAHFEGETDEQTAAHLKALQVEADGMVARDNPDIRKQIDAEIERIRGPKSTRLRGGDAETR